MAQADGSSAKKPHVGIIGAGISGLRCADILLSRGVEVTIIEARDRIGGRACRIFSVLCASGGRMSY